MSENNEKLYNASKIKVLKGLEAIKLRPGMYTRTESPNHIIYEVIDNAQDEALAGYATKITVRVLNGETVEIEDNGRGIPVDMHLDADPPRPALEVIFSELHSGGKFDKENDGAYSFSGGLHGVGVSVTNALSKELTARVKRDGKEYEIVFNDGSLKESLKEIGKVLKKDTGTKVITTPDLKYFDNKLNIEQLKNYLRVKSALLKGVEISFQIDDESPIVWNYSNLKEYLIAESNKANEETFWATDAVIEENVANQTNFIWEFEKYLDTSSSSGKNGEGLQVVVGFIEEGKRINESFVNLIPTLNGGTHERGLRNGLFEGLKNFMNHYNLTPKITLESDDLWQRSSFVLSNKILDPQFQGQTKEKLSSEHAARLNMALIKDGFELWLNENLDFAKRLVDLVILSAQKRKKVEPKTERKKSFSNTTLPGKLSDCEENNAELTELFLVEGDSAAGSSKMGRNKDFQAILPLRGKILNTWEINAEKILESSTISDISTAIGVLPHTLEEEVDFSKLRYHKICTLCDADVDGRHIEVLLKTLFLKHFPQLVKRGHLFVAKAPLFRVDYPSNKKAKSKLDKKVYIQTNEELESLIKKLNKDGFGEDSIKISRFKGLGEMNPEQLWDTTLNPENRTLIQISIDVDHLDSDMETFNLLMSKKEAGKRKDWMEEKGNTVNIDV